MAIIIGDPETTGTFTDNQTLELAGASRVETITIGGRTFVIVSGLSDDGVQVFELGADGLLTDAGQVLNDSILQLNGAAGIEPLSVGGNDFIVVTGFDDDGVSVFQIDADGVLTNTDNVSIDVSNPLNGANRLDSLEINGTTFVFVSAGFSDAVTVYELSSSGQLNLVDSVNDSELDVGLNGVVDVETVSTANGNFLFATGEDGITTYAIASNGELSRVDFLTDNGALALNDPREIRAFDFNGQTLLAVTAQTDDALSLFSINADGTLTEVAQFQDFTLLNGAEAIDTYSVNGEQFIVVASQFADNVSVFHLADDLTLTRVQDFGLFGTPGTDGPFGIAVEIVDGQPVLIVSSNNDSALFTFNLAGGTDALEGTAEDDLIFGFNGDDAILGEDGADRLFAGNGRDFVSGGAGDDFLNGGAGADVLDGGAGEDTVDFSDSSGGVTATLAALRAGEGGDAEGDIFFGIENLVGSAFNDLLAGSDIRNEFQGGAGDDTLSGLGGNDLLEGEDGNDTLVGGDGNDVVNGGVGNDRVVGNSGADNLIGGAGNDELISGSGNDVANGGGGADFIRGGAGDDTLNGGGGVDNILGELGEDTLDGGNGNDVLRGGDAGDTLIGGAGADALFGDGGDDFLTGGAGADRFVIRANEGFDTITDFEIGTDVIDLSVNAFFSNFADVQDAALQFGSSVAISVGSNVILIEDTLLSDLSASDFLF